MRPRVSIIGLHPVHLTKRALVENAIAVFGEGHFNLDDLTCGSDVEFTERFANLYLFEIRIEDSDGRVDPGEFVQPMPGIPSDSWQVAYDEKFLNDDGTAALDGPPAKSSIRLGFFLHFVELEEPLSTPSGLVRLPAPTPMPQRLAGIFRYISP